MARTSLNFIEFNTENQNVKKMKVNLTNWPNPKFSRGDLQIGYICRCKTDLEEKLSLF